MSNEKDLDSFRQAWKFELSSPQESRHARAKKLYLKGVELEREGMCYEAIEFFRQALKLVPDLEKHVDVTKELENFNPSSSSSTGLEFYEVVLLLISWKYTVYTILLSLSVLKHCYCFRTMPGHPARELQL